MEADLKEVNDRTVKALTDSIDYQLRQHSQEAISDVARRLRQIKAGGEAQPARTKSSECDLRCADAEAAIVRIESA